MQRDQVTSDQVTVKPSAAQLSYVNCWDVQVVADRHTIGDRWEPPTASSAIIVIQILYYLSVKDLLSLVSHTMNDIIHSSSYIQHQIDTALAGVVDNPNGTKSDLTTESSYMFPSLTSSSIGSYCRLPMQQSKLQSTKYDNNDDLGPNSVPYSSLAEANVLPQTDHFAFSSSDLGDTIFMPDCSSSPPTNSILDSTDIDTD
jgi:hypothetical protein